MSFCGPPRAKSWRQTLKFHSSASPDPLNDRSLRSFGKSGAALGGTEYRLMPSAYRLIVRAKFTISIPRESCTNAKAKYNSSVVPPDPSVHFYHCRVPKVTPPLKILDPPMTLATAHYSCPDNAIGLVGQCELDRRVCYTGLACGGNWAEIFTHFS